MKQHPKNENNMTHKHGIKHNIHHHGTINVFAYHVGFQVKYHCWQFIKHLDVSFGGKTNFLNVSYKNTFRTEKKNTNGIQGIFLFLHYVLIILNVPCYL